MKTIHDFYELKDIKNELATMDKNKNTFKNEFISNTVIESLLKLCITSFKLVKDNDIKQFNMLDYPLHERIKIIDLLPVSVINGKNGLLTFLIETFYTPLLDINLKFPCPHCGEINSKNVDITDFFL